MKGGFASSRHSMGVVPVHSQNLLILGQGIAIVLILCEKLGDLQMQFRIGRKSGRQSHELWLRRNTGIFLQQELN